MRISDWSSDVCSSVLDTLLRAAVPTVNELSDRGAKVLILAHFGRPKGLVNPDMSLAQTVSALSSVLGRPVTFIPDCQGEEAKAAIARLGNGDIALLETTRFHAGEAKNDPVLIEAMAALGDLYVNDAFSAAHRAHVSPEGLPHNPPAFSARALE